MAHPDSILLTGRPGVGKTTAILRVLEVLRSKTAQGFYTVERRIEGRRQGFNTVLIPDGRLGLLASPDVKGETRFGSLMPDGRRRLGVDFSFLETIACPYLRSSANGGLVVIDEIGPMQASSPVFRQAIGELIGSDRLILASIAGQPHDWLDVVKRESGISIMEVTADNRNTVPATVAARLDSAAALGTAAQPSRQCRNNDLR